MGDARLCVLCHTRAVEPRWRPFCSERCRNEDLAQWADGHYRVASDALSAPETNPDSEPDN